MREHLKGDDPVTIVSGLPRSGTSLMMMMLKAGGVEIVTDHLRQADEDNPGGYYEYERVKKIKEDASWLDACKGKAVKMVSMLLFDLPADRKYMIIFMERDMQEMLASQSIMLQRRGQQGSETPDEEMEKIYTKHLHHIEEWIAGQDNIDVLHVKYNDVIRDPAKYARMVNQFMGGRLNVGEMERVVDLSLYRQRSDNRGKD